VPRVPAPFPGLVIRYCYLWLREFDEGEVEGRRRRPCAVVVCVEDVDGETVVTVAPLTHLAPECTDDAVELTPATRRRLGLHPERNWVMSTEVNRFCWPGPDLAPTPGEDFAYGELPAVAFRALVEKILAIGDRAGDVSRKGI
jgi:hypothetical protein